MIKLVLRSFFDSELKVAVLLFILAVGAYWEISLLQYSVQYDMLDVVLPWRFHVGECLRHNIFPFWNPYQSTGYPIHADLQCPTFYPETLIIGSVFGYSNITLHILFTIYIFLAGFGMYRLLKHFGAINIAAFITGAAFMLSGVFVSHVQHFFAIIGFTWIPWVLLYYLRMSEEPWQFRHILPLSFFSFLMISGGYQALSIITAYLLATLFIYYIITFLRRKNSKALLRLILSNLAWLGIVLLLSAVILVSTWNVYDYIGRFSGLSAGEALFNPFTPRSLISLFAPFGVAKDPNFLQTDLSMANMYVGVIMLAFFITGLMRRQSRVVYVLLIFGIIAMLAAFGDHLPVRLFLFKYFPMMDLFRLPAYFRFFMVIPVFILAGMALSDLLRDREKVRKLFALSFFIVGMGVLAVFIWSAAQISGNQFVLLDTSLNLGEKMQQAPIFEHIMIHSLLILVLFITFFLLYYYKVMNMKILLSLFIILEMVIAVQLNITYTGCSTDWHPIKIRSELRMHPAGFPVPRPGKISENTDKAYTFQPLWRNVNIFNKTVSYDCFTSFKFAGYKYLEDSVPQLKEAVLQNPVLYFSDEVYPGSEMVVGKVIHTGPKTLYVPDEVYASFDRQALKSDSSDRITITHFKPGEVGSHVSTCNPQVLTLLQSNYREWQVLVDGEQAPHFTSNKLYLSFLLDEGDHEVVFKYRNNAVKAAFVISYSTLLFILFLMTWQKIGDRYGGRRLPLIVISVSVILFILFFKLMSIRRAGRSEKIYSEVVENAMEWENSKPGQTRFVFAVDDATAFGKAYEGADADFQYELYRHADPHNIISMVNREGSVSREYLWYSGIKTRKRHEIWPVFRSDYPDMIEYSDQPISEMLILGKEGTGGTDWIFEDLNDFEAPDPEWFGYNHHLDSSFAWSGMVSNRLDSAARYSHTLSMHASEIDAFNPVFHLSAWVYPEKDCNAYLVIEVRRNDELVGYNTRAIHDALEERDKWNKVIFSTGTNLRLHPDDEIKAFIWNDSKARMWVDDISLRIGESLY